MKKLLLSALFSLFLFSALNATDTIPPVFHFYKGKLIRIPIGGVFAYTPAYWVSDNQTDSQDIVVTETWGTNGRVNTFIKKSYPLYLVATDTNGNKSYDTAIYMVDDTIPPVIHLNTPDHVCVVYRTAYTSVQPTVTDNYYNSNQVSLILKSTDVNTNVIGIYTEVFEAVDGSGNVSTKIRFVHVQEVCNNVSVSSVSVNKVQIYPNPSSGKLNVAGLENLTFSVSLLDMNGKVVLNAANSNCIDVSMLPGGLYMVLIETDSDKYYFRYTIGL